MGRARDRAAPRPAEALAFGRPPNAEGVADLVLELLAIHLVQNVVRVAAPLQVPGHADEDAPIDRNLAIELVFSRGCAPIPC